jgi:8-oxo-dGTP pyrophosphatase MutT (NUDIX family)
VPIATRATAAGAAACVAAADAAPGPASVSSPDLPALPVSVKGVVLDSSERVLLLRNERAEWELPGGRIARGETPPEAVAREIREEAGWEVVPGPILDAWVYEIRAVDRQVFVVTYGCFPLSDRPPVRSGEHDAIGLFTRDELPDLALPDGYRQSVATWRADPRRTG